MNGTILDALARSRLQWYPWGMKTCTIPGCDKPHLAKGWCGTHYSRNLKGRPMDAVLPEPLPERCEVEGCDAKPIAKRMCQPHYDLMRRWGTLGPREKRKRKPRSVPFDREGAFWSKVYYSWAGCWLWTGSIGRNGYGRVGMGPGKSPGMAHRVAWEFTNGPIPRGLVLDHLCRVKACVRPDHLEPVSQALNLERARRV